MTWQYKIVQANAVFQETLNSNGKDGWELIAIQSAFAAGKDNGFALGPSSGSLGFFLVFKKPV
jgi:hypothetical protein